MPAGTRENVSARTRPSRSAAPHDQTFPAIVEARGLEQPDKVVFTWLGDGAPRDTTYGELLAAVRRIAADLSGQVAPGERAVLVYPPGADYIAAFLGCLHAGIIAVPCYPPRNRRGAERIAAILADCSPALAMTSLGAAESLRKLVACGNWLETSIDGCSDAHAAPARTIHPACPDGIAFLQYTSGSTGTPKGVMISHHNLVTDASLIQSAFSLDEHSIGATWLPPYHDMGLIGGLLEVIYLGIHSVVMAPNAFLQKPYGWLKAISDYRVTHSGAPNFAYDLCVSRITDQQKATLDLSSWAAAYCGAEPIRPHTLDRFAAAFAGCGFRRNAFLTCYGLAEATLMVSSSRRGEGPRLGTHDDEPEKTLVSSGEPVTQQMKIVDPHSRTVLNDGQIGEIWVAGPNVAAGYWGNEAATRECFDVRLTDAMSDTAFMRTGDLGFLRDGQLFVSGRIKDLIIINGRNIYPQDVEAASFGSHADLRIDAAAAFTIEHEDGERLVVVQELDFRKSVDDVMCGRIAEAVFERIGVQPSTIVLVKAGTVPRTSSGKIRRRQCRADFINGTLPELARHERNEGGRAAAARLDARLLSRGEGAQDSRASDPSPSAAAIVEWLCARLESRLNLPTRSIDPAQSFFYHGVDSIQAVETCGALAEWLDRPVEPMLFWDYPTPAELARHLAGQTATPRAVDDAEPSAISHHVRSEPVAIIGMGCRFPGADGPEAFWQMLLDGVDAVREVPAARTAAGSFRNTGDSAIAYTRIGGFLDEVDRFDGDLFGIAPIEAVRIDPQQRLVLEVAWEALENAGIAAATLAGSQTGVFVGVSSHDYDEVRTASREPLSLYDATGSSVSVVANRLSYLLDLRGPSLAIDTACSSSLVAVHAACRSLLNGESRLAMAGGVNLILSATSSAPFAKSGLLSPDGRCKAFDDSANGYVRGEGCGMVVLKRLSDALRDGDPVRAVILGSAVQQDGRSNGLAAPNGIAQAEVIRQALAQAHVSPAALDHVEAHGTGTALGDPVELNALKAVLNDGGPCEHPCIVSSVKTNIGHLEAAAGVAGLIKTVLALEHDTMPAHLHFRQLNRHCTLDGTRLEIGGAARAWPRSRRRYAGVSSFGFGGTLAHLVVADAPPVPEAAASDSRMEHSSHAAEASPHLLVWSAKTPTALEQMTDRLAARLRSEDGSLADIAYSLQTGRNALSHRRALVCTDRIEAASLLERRDFARLIDAVTNLRAQPVPVFMFPGQGAQRIGMAHDLYRRFPVFREHFDACSTGFASLIGVDLCELLFARSGVDDARRATELEQTALAQPALFAAEYATARWLMSLGIVPGAMIGHSLGEYVAACLAGVFSFDDALEIVALRGRLMQSQPPGAMATVALGEEALGAWLMDGLSLAAVNGGERCVVSGETSRIDAFVAELNARDVPCRRLHVSHAFHSVMMEPVCEPLREAVARIALHAPAVPFISNVTGDWIDAADAVDPAYWARHLREPVRFAAGLTALAARFGDAALLLEAGPGTTLQTFARQCAYRDGGTPALVLPVLGGEHDAWTFFTALGQLWGAGYAPDWAALHRDAGRRRLTLPTYPFDRQRHWLDPSIESASVFAAAQESTIMSPPFTSPSTSLAAQHAAVAADDGAGATSARRAPRRDRIQAKLRELVAGLLQVEPERVSPHAALLELGADSLVLVQAVRRLEEMFGVAVTIRQLFEELTSIAELAAYMDRHLPATWDNEEPGAQPVAQPAAQPQLVQPAALPAATVPPISTTPAGGTASPPANGLENLIAQQLDVMRLQLSLMRDTAPALPKAMSDTVNESAAATVTRSTSAISHDAGTRPAALRPAQQGFDPYSKLEQPQQAYLHRFIADLLKRTAGSKAHARQYRDVIADYRALAGFRFSAKDTILPLSLGELFYPIVAARSEGAHIIDVDGNDYVDLAMGFGVALFGHSPSFIREAIGAQLAEGMHLGPQSPLAGEIASMVRTLTGMERVAFCNSGTEAMMLAVRLARTRNGRPKIAQFTGSYHGWADGVLVAADPDRDPYALPAAPGLQTGSGEQALVLEYGSAHALQMIRDHAHELSAVLVEPVQSRRPELQPREFLHQLRALTKELDITLIFDEMITGFRLHPGGAQAWFDVRADLVAYGKAAGGGMPIGIVAGDAAHMNGIDGGTVAGAAASVDTTFFAGTFSKHPLALASTHAVLTHLIESGPALQAALTRRTDALVARLNRLFSAHDLPMQMVNCGSLFRLHCLHNLDLFCYHLVANGLYVWEGRTMYLSTAHSDADIDLIYDAFEASARALVHAGFFAGAKPLPPSGGRRPAPGVPVALHAQPKAAAGALAAVTKDQARAVAPRCANTSATAARDGTRTPDFSLSFFGTYDADYQENKYDLLFEAARFADEQRFSAIWLPERHFHAFGGLSPNPSVLAAALARETRHVDLRAGSVVLPLHHPVRVAEEWSVVDNLSDGRVGIAVASGWHPNDFVFAPEVFGRHRDLTFERLGQIQRLWSGAELHLPDGSGQAFAAALFPMPRQKRLPVWVTVVGNPDTYSKAAELGAGILTNLMGQSIDDLASNIALYRRKLAAHGYDARQGKVTVLLHTFVGADREAARRDARQPFLDYLKSSVGLFQNMARALGVQIEGDLKPEDEAYLLSVAYERYTASSALIGDPVSCAEIVRKLAAIGVDEIGCFIDFGVDPHAVMASLPYLQQVRELVAQPPAAPDADEATSAGAAPAPQVWPASTAQRWLWLDHQRGAQNSAHSITAVVELPGAVAVASLDRALEQIVARHEVLRTTFAQQDEDVVQIVGAAHPVRVATKTAQSATDVNVLLAALAADAFDLERGPLFRALRVDMTDGRRLLLWCMHEIVADGASAVLLQEEINALMHADAQGIANPLPPLTMQYRHYAAMQRENLCSASHAARDYWHRQLAAPLPVLDLPFDHPLGVATSAAGARTGRVIGGALYEQVKALTRTRHSTLFMFLQAAVAAWLSRLTGQDDVVIAAPVGARVQPGTEQLIGFFLNTVLLRHRVTATERFTDLLRRVRMTVFDGLEHQDYPFEQLIDELKPPRVRNAFPVTPVMLNVLNYRGAAAAEEQFWSGALNMKAELELYASELDGELRLVCHYRTGLFTASTVDYLIDELVALMGQIVANPDRVIGDFDLFDGNTSPRSGYLRFIEPLEAAHAGQPAIDPLVSRIAAHVRNTPDAGAVESTHGTLSYAALWAQSSAALHAWTERLGVQRGVVVALMCGDRVQHVVSMLAAFRGGLITTPFSAHEPLPRQRAMIDAVEPALWVVDDATLGRLVELHADRSLNVAVWGKVDDRREPPRLPAAWRVVWIDAGSARDDAAQADEAADTRGPAYIFFTSGSTGEPKPIVGRGDSLAQFVDWEIDELALDATVRVSQLASLTFDASLRDIFVPLCAGGTLCIPPLPTRDIEPEALLDWLDAQRISLAHTVPSVFRVWLPLLRSSAQLPALTHLLMSGEPLLPNDVRRWHDVLGERVRLINLYGATETTLVRCFHRVTAADAARDFIPIGRPMPGTRAIVLDANRQICPPGVTGELWLRTAYGTLGYYRQPERTAKVFVSDLFGGAGLDHGEIVYRTGDLATWLDDGTLRLFGRRDMQVKVRGVRVEPEEIENILYAHGEIELAAVVARTLRSGETTLNAYYTAPDELDPAAVKTYLTERLPAELVPSIVERRKTLPLTASGKVDRLALSEGRIVEPVVYEAPLGDLEAAMATLLAQILELPRVGRHDNFFEIGGHSLRALRAISRIRKVFGVDLAPDRFFEAATPAALALEVQTLRDGRRDALRDSLIPPLRRRAPDTTLPLSFEQERVWTQETLGLAGTSYSIPVALTLNGVVDADALERSLSALTQRHEILRTHFESADGNARQIVDAPRPFPLERLDLAALDDTAQRAEIDRLLSGQIDHPFDLATGPLLRATLVRLAETRHVMLLNMHHIVSDGWSADVLVREMSMLYGAFSSGRAVPLEPLPVQYGDYALWQRGWLQGTLLEQQLGYWKTTLAGAPAALALPTDRPRPSEQSFRGARTRFALSATLAARLAELGQRDNATLYMVLLAGFAVLLGRHSGQQDIVIGAPIAGRRVQELESLIGFFVNTLALRTSLAGNPTFAELVARVRKNALSAYAHQDLPFEKLVAELQPVRDLSRQPVFQVMFGFQQATPPLSLPGLQIQQLESGAMAVKFDLSLQMLQGAEGIECVMEYATDLFDRATIDRLIRHYVNLLEAAAADPRQRVGQLPLLDAEERCRLLEVWNDTKAAYPEDRCLHELFEEQASRTPEAVAVVFEGA
ncbi:MupA/Atu3671 family FMN-dependent luciferase-like monooxygenase, partial [Burkholderia stagnalis]